MAVFVAQDPRLAAARRAALWTTLLVAAQTIDVITTAVDQARGTVESMAMSALLLDHGGPALLLGSKLLLAGAAATALGVAALRIKRQVKASQITFQLTLAAVQAATIGLVWVSLNNVALLWSLAR